MIWTIAALSALVVGLLMGTGAVLLIVLPLYRKMLGETIRAQQIANDRLYAAWKDGYQIPPKEAVAPEPKEIRLLPKLLAEYVQNWEDPTVRAELEAEARRMHFELGYPEERVIETFKARQ